MTTTMHLLPTTDWDALAEAVAAIAGKASVGVTPEQHADTIWQALGTRRYVPLRIVEDGRSVGALFYEVQRVPGGEPILHLAGTYIDGSAEREWMARLREQLVTLAGSLGCGERIYFSSPRGGWWKRAPRHGFSPVSQAYWYEGGDHG